MKIKKYFVAVALTASSLAWAGPSFPTCTSFDSQAYLSSIPASRLDIGMLNSNALAQECLSKQLKPKRGKQLASTSDLCDIVIKDTKSQAILDTTIYEIAEQLRPETYAQSFQFVLRVKELLNAFDWININNDDYIKTLELKEKRALIADAYLRKLFFKQTAPVSYNGNDLVSNAVAQRHPLVLFRLENFIDAAIDLDDAFLGIGAESLVTDTKNFLPSLIFAENCKMASE